MKNDSIAVVRSGLSAHIYKVEGPFVIKTLVISNGQEKPIKDRVLCTLGGWEERKATFVDGGCQVVEYD